MDKILAVGLNLGKKAEKKAHQVISNPNLPVNHIGDILNGLNGSYGAGQTIQTSAAGL